MPSCVVHLFAPQPDPRRSSVATGCGDARSLSTQETGRQGLWSSRLRVGAEAAAEAGTHPCNFPKENHPSVLPDAAMRSCRCFWPVPTAFPALLSLRRPRSKPSPVSLHEPTLRQADNSASLFPPLRPSRGSCVHHAVRLSVPPSLRPLCTPGAASLALQCPRAPPACASPLLFMMSEIGS